jgi:hypothetical protein
LRRRLFEHVDCPRRCCHLLPLILRTENVTSINQ